MVVFGKTLYYPGCISKIKVKHISLNYQNLLNNLGIKFITLKDIELCCGIPALNAGYKEEFFDIVNKNKEIFENQKITKIISNCPSCCRIFREEYGIKTEHVTEVIFRHMNKIKKDYNNEKVAYHDPCNLGRKLKVYDEPRAILRSIGFELVEFKNNHENAFCCGAGGLLKLNSPRIADRIAVERLKQTTAKKVVTACPLCYLHLKNNAKGLEVLELSEVLV